MPLNLLAKLELINNFKTHRKKISLILSLIADCSLFLINFAEEMRI